MSLFDRLVVSTLPLVPKFIVGRVAARYIAGETLDEAIATIRSLNEEGAMATLDLLGEDCVSQGFDGGVLACAGDCTAFTTPTRPSTSPRACASIRSKYWCRCCTSRRSS